MGKADGGAGLGRGGFTLVELLVVLAIILLLISMALPGLVGARETGWATVCASRLREFYLVFDGYADAHRDFYPAPWANWPSAGINQWPYSISGHLTGVRAHTDYTQRMNAVNVPQAFCPKMLRLGVWWYWNSPKEAAYMTYSFSVLRLTDSGTPFIGLAAQRSRIPDASGTALLGDGDAPVNEHPGYPWMNAWMYHSNVRVHPHRNRSNYAFCDGHVKLLGEADIQPNPRMFIAY